MLESRSRRLPSSNQIVVTNYYIIFDQFRELL